MSVTKPTAEYLWDTNDTNTADPGAALRLDGYAFRDILPSDEFNWLMKSRGDWLTFLLRNSSWDSVSDGIEATEPGDIFRVSSDVPPMHAEAITAVYGTVGIAWPMYLDTDGVYVVWIAPDDKNKIIVDRIDGTGARVVCTIPAAETADSLACDGETIFVTTSTSLRSCDYTGAWLGNVAQTGTIYDVGMGHVLIRESATVWRVRDNSAALTSVSTQTLAGDTIQAGKFAGTGVCDVVIEYESAGGSPGQYLRKADDSSTTIWDYMITGSPTGTTCGGLWIDGPFIHCVLNDTNDYLVTVPHGDEGPISERILQLVGSYDHYCATPHFLIAHDTVGVGSDELHFIGWDGTELGCHYSLDKLDIFGNSVCDGMDFFFCRPELGGAYQVYRQSLGGRGMSMRRYDTDEWRPFCHSRAVCCERVYIGAGVPVAFGP